MSTVQEIETAIAKLPRQDFAALERWWNDYLDKVWYAQLAEDAQPDGRLSKFLSQVDADIDAGQTTPFPK